MIRIITDGTCDVSEERAKKWGVDILPLTVRFGDEVFIQGVELSNKEFYEKLADSDRVPTTSQVNPYSFEKVYKKYLEAGDDIVGIFISHYLSGTYQSAVLAKQNLGADNVYLIDSYSISMGMELLLAEAVRMRDDGASAKEIDETIRALIPRLHYVASLDNLDYLRAGGRLTTNTLARSSVTGVYPVITVIGGKLENIGQVHGRKACYPWLLKRLLSENADMESLIGFNHSNAPDRSRECMDYVSKHANPRMVVEGEIGPIIGTHLGAGAMGIAFFSK